MWLFYELLEPEGLKEDYRAGIATAHVVNNIRATAPWSRGHRPKFIQPDDIFPVLRAVRERGRIESSSSQERKPTSLEEFRRLKQALKLVAQKK